MHLAAGPPHNHMGSDDDRQKRQAVLSYSRLNLRATEIAPLVGLHPQTVRKYLKAASETLANDPGMYTTTESQLPSVLALWKWKER